MRGRCRGGTARESGQLPFITPVPGFGGRAMCSEDSKITYAENGQEDVDQQVGAAPALEEDTQRREDDGEDHLADVAGGERHGGGVGG